MLNSYQAEIIAVRSPYGEPEHLECYLEGEPITEEEEIYRDPQGRFTSPRSLAEILHRRKVEFLIRYEVDVERSREIEWRVEDYRGRPLVEIRALAPGVFDDRLLDWADAVVESEQPGSLGWELLSRGIEDFLYEHLEVEEIECFTCGKDIK